MLGKVYVVFKLPDILVKWGSYRSKYYQTLLGITEDGDILETNDILLSYIESIQRMNVTYLIHNTHNHSYRNNRLELLEPVGLKNDLSQDILDVNTWWAQVNDTVRFGGETFSPRYIFKVYSVEQYNYSTVGTGSVLFQLESDIQKTEFGYELYINATEQEETIKYGPFTHEIIFSKNDENTDDNKITSGTININLAKINTDNNFFIFLNKANKSIALFNVSKQYHYITLQELANEPIKVSGQKGVNEINIQTKLSNIENKWVIDCTLFYNDTTSINNIQNNIIIGADISTTDTPPIENIEIELLNFSNEAIIYFDLPSIYQETKHYDLRIYVDKNVPDDDLNKRMVWSNHAEQLYRLYGKNVWFYYKGGTNKDVTYRTKFISDQPASSLSPYEIQTNVYSGDATFQIGSGKSSIKQIYIPSSGTSYSVEFFTDYDSNITLMKKDVFIDDGVSRSDSLFDSYKPHLNVWFYWYINDDDSSYTNDTLYRTKFIDSDESSDFYKIRHEIYPGNAIPEQVQLVNPIEGGIIENIVFSKQVVDVGFHRIAKHSVRKPAFETFVNKIDTDTEFYCRFTKLEDGNIHLNINTNTVLPIYRGKLLGALNTNFEKVELTLLYGDDVLRIHTGQYLYWANCDIELIEEDVVDQIQNLGLEITINPLNTNVIDTVDDITTYVVKFNTNRELTNQYIHSLDDEQSMFKKYGINTWFYWYIDGNKTVIYRSRFLSGLNTDGLYDIFHEVYSGNYSDDSAFWLSYEITTRTIVTVDLKLVNTLINNIMQPIVTDIYGYTNLNTYTTADDIIFPLTIFTPNDFNIIDKSDAMELVYDIRSKISRITDKNKSESVTYMAFMNSIAIHLAYTNHRITLQKSYLSDIVSLSNKVSRFKLIKEIQYLQQRVVNHIYYDFVDDSFELRFKKDTLYRLFNRINIHFEQELLDFQTSNQLRLVHNVTRTMPGIIPSIENDYTITLPLNFWFNQKPHSYLPIAAMQYQKLSLTIELDDWIDCLDNDDEQKQIIRQQGLVPKISCLSEYITLDKNERIRFNTSRLEYLITRTQLDSKHLQNISNTIPIDITDTIKDLMWVVWDNDTNEPVEIQKCSFYLSNETTYEITNPTYYTTIVPYEKYNSVHITDKDVYCYYSFALYPTLYQPSGSCNIGLIPNKSMNIMIKAENNVIPSNMKLEIFAHKYDVLVVENGHATIAHY